PVLQPAQLGLQPAQFLLVDPALHRGRRFRSGFLRHGSPRPQRAWASACRWAVPHRRVELAHRVWSGLAAGAPATKSITTERGSTRYVLPGTSGAVSQGTMLRGPYGLKDVVPFPSSCRGRNHQAGSSLRGTAVSHRRVRRGGVGRCRPWRGGGAPCAELVLGPPGRRIL